MTRADIPHRLRRTLDDLSSSPDAAGQLFKSLFENSHSVMLIIHPANGAIIEANRAACSFYQYPKEKLTSMTIMDINTLPPERVREEMQLAKTEQRDHFNFKHRLADGNVRDVEVYSSPITLADDKVLYSIIHDVSERLRTTRERDTLIDKLTEAQDEISALKGILPLCSFCKKIRDHKGEWEQVDAYIRQHSDADVSHTVCPECMRKHYPEFENEPK